jgi:hypothetical protein
VLQTSSIITAQQDGEDIVLKNTDQISIVVIDDAGVFRYVICSTSQAKLLRHWFQTLVAQPLASTAASEC